MNVKNKFNLKKVIIISVFIIAVSNIIFGIFNYCEYKKYEKNFNKKLDAIITNLNKKYPNISNEELIKILNSEQGNSNYILKSYGIDLNKDSLIFENDTYFIKFLILKLIIVTVIFIILLCIFLKYNSSKNKKIYEITKYMEELNKRNYKLDIDDNTEDELSILKNEIYKTTVMLKESAENSIKDKTSLKDSLSDISHQLKTPLTSISIMLDNILDNPQMDMNTRNEFINDIKRQIININFLVSSLLKLSKLDINSVTFLNKEVYIQNIINKSIKNVAVLCDLKNIEINICKKENYKICCDFNWQVEAITNILKNAIEHSNNNSKINIKYEQNKIYTKIEIRDFGIGIDKQDLPHIFERFYRGKNSSNDSVGIGLALAKSIIDKNNGDIIVNSEENKGTTFIIKYYM